jgi:sugar/nucleoside kinase (ribokinase family)
LNLTGSLGFSINLTNGSIVFSQLNSEKTIPKTFGEIEEILKFANAVAALKCQDLGGRKGIPTLEEVQKFLRQF